MPKGRYRLGVGFLPELGLLLCLGSCASGGVQSQGRWPAINPGCERVQLVPAGQSAPFATRPLRPLRGSWDEPNKDLRNWITNKACDLGADAVVDLVETTGRDKDGPVWNIQGTAVVYDRTRPSAPPPSASPGAAESAAPGAPAAPPSATPSGPAGMTI